MFKYRSFHVGAIPEVQTQDGLSWICMNITLIPNCTPRFLIYEFFGLILMKYFFTL